MMLVPGHVDDASRLITEEVSTGAVQGYLAAPREGNASAGVVVIHEAFGLVDHIRDVARRLAALGYAVLAPDLYAEVGPPDPTDVSDVIARMFELPDASAVASLAAGADLLRKRFSTIERVGAAGFCSGARQGFLWAADPRAPDALVFCWGGFLDRATPNEEVTPARPATPLSFAPGVACPLLIVGGEEDDNPSPEVLASLADRCRESGQPLELAMFPDAGHAFFADYRPSYRPEPAHRLWQMMTKFLAAHCPP